MTPFSGQAVNAGHFLQPTTRAMGQRVISFLLVFGLFAAGSLQARLGRPWEGVKGDGQMVVGPFES